MIASKELDFGRPLILAHEEEIVCEQIAACEAAIEIVGLIRLQGERNSNLIVDRLEGHSYGELGKRYKVSPSRAQQIVRKFLRTARYRAKRSERIRQHLKGQWRDWMHNPSSCCL